MAELSSTKIYGDLTVSRNATVRGDLTVNGVLYQDPSSKDEPLVVGANASYGEKLLIGGWGNDTGTSWVRTSSGNLHIDSKSDKHIYLNHYHAGNVYMATDGGDVGVNTTSPAYKLDVNGNFRSTGSARFDSNVEIGGNLEVIGNRIGFITNSYDAEIRVSDENPNGTGAVFTFWGDGVERNAQLEAKVGVFTADLYVGSQIFHNGDTDTYMQFHAANQWRVVTGGSQRLEVNNSNTQVSNELIAYDGIRVDGSTQHSYAGIRGNGTNGHLMLDSTGSGNVYLNWDNRNQDIRSYGRWDHTGNADISGDFRAGNIWVDGNDVVDFAPCDRSVHDGFGKVYVIEKGVVKLAEKYAQKNAIGVASDNYNLGIGKKTDSIPISIGGYVEAYIDKEYQPGTPLTSSKDGYLTRAKWWTRVFTPERILATFYKVGEQRHWVKIT